MRIPHGLRTFFFSGPDDFDKPRLTRYSLSQLGAFHPGGTMKKTTQSRAANLSFRTIANRVLIAALLTSVALPSLPDRAHAQSYSFGSVQVQGNARIETGTILSYAGIARGQTLSAAELNDAYQRLVASGLF